MDINRNTICSALRTLRLVEQKYIIRLSLSHIRHSTGTMMQSCAFVFKYNITMCSTRLTVQPYIVVYGYSQMYKRLKHVKMYVPLQLCIPCFFIKYLFTTYSIRYDK